jgi:phosphate acetyltransferase
VALKSMAAQGKFGGAIVDGPLTPDSALSADAARMNGVTSEIAGRVDVLIAPSMESALMVLRTILAFSSGLAAGIVLGARIPIVIPARNDSMEMRMASCVLASLAVAAVNGTATHQAGPAGSPIAAVAA